MAHKMDLLPRGVWHPQKDEILLTDSWLKNWTDPAAFFLWEEKFVRANFEAMAIQWSKTEQEDKNARILNSLCSLQQIFLWPWRS